MFKSIISQVTEQKNAIQLYFRILSEIKFFIPFVALTWATGYILMAGYGFYEDDWTAVGGVSKYDLYARASSPIDWLKTWPHGRPVGWFFMSIFGFFGRLTNDIFTHYVVALLLIALNARLLFAVIDYKYGIRAALLVTIIFCLSPINSTHIQLTMVFLGYTGLSFALAGILAFQKKRFALSMFLGALCLTSYESIFFIYAMAAAFTYTLPSVKYVVTQIRFGIACLGLLGCYAFLRLKVFSAGLFLYGNNSHSILDRVSDVFTIYIPQFFKILMQSYSLGLSHISVGGLVVFLGIVVFGVFIDVKIKEEQPKIAKPNDQTLLDIFIVASLLLVASLIITGFSSVYPGKPFGGRNTRIFITSFFALGMITFFFYAIIEKALPKRMGIIPLLTTLCLLFPLANNSFKVQEDYVKSWKIQANVITQVISQVCDLDAEDVIAMELTNPHFRKHDAIGSHSFGYATFIADAYDWGETHYYNKPRMMRLKKNWEEALRIDAEGNLIFEKQIFSGIPVIANRKIKPGDLILFRQDRLGRVVRDDSPIIVSGVQFNKPPVSNIQKGCFTRSHPPTGDIGFVVVKY